jgi:hypothetical protein
MATERQEPRRRREGRPCRGTGTGGAIGRVCCVGRDFDSLDKRSASIDIESMLPVEMTPDAFEQFDALPRTIKERMRKRTKLLEA